MKPPDHVLHFQPMYNKYLRGTGGKLSLQTSISMLFTPLRRYFQDHALQNPR
ncbi:MAG: hypothetical protein QXZ11_05500 [Thermoproteota archaeon]